MEYHGRGGEVQRKADTAVRSEGSQRASTRERCFFDPNNAEDLAKKMWDLWQQPPTNEDVDVLKRVNEEALQKFARDYCAIVQSS